MGCVPKLKRRNDGGYYIHTAGDTNPVNTFQVTSQGVNIIRSSGCQIGDYFGDSLFFLLYDLGHLSTTNKSQSDLAIQNIVDPSEVDGELSVEARVEVVTQIVETHSIDTLFTGEAANWVRSLLRQPAEDLVILGQVISSESGYRLSTILEYNNSVESGEKVVEVALCGYLQLKWLREEAVFETSQYDNSKRTLLGTDGDLAHIETPHEDTRTFGIPDEMPGDIQPELRSELQPVWAKGIGVAGFAALTSMDVESRYDVDNGITIPKSRLDDFPVDGFPTAEESGIVPNEVADLYEALFTLREAFPDDVNPLWELAIESILFGGDGLADGNKSYGELQADNNAFKIAEYRSHYGNGTRVTEFPAITTSEPLEQDLPYLDTETVLPVAPKSDQVLPLNPDSEDLADAFSLLNEFPSTPGEERQGADDSDLLNPSKFPGIPSEAEPIEPNELADLYDCFRILLDQLPDEFQVWEIALRSVLEQTEYTTMSMPYGEQIKQRNTFSMDEYRTVYDDGEKVTRFPTLSTYTIQSGDFDHLTEDIFLPTEPQSGESLPASPVDSSIQSALSLLQKFPAWPQAERRNDETEAKEGELLDIDAVLRDSEIDIDPNPANQENQSEVEASSYSSGSEPVQPNQPDTEMSYDEPADVANEETVLRDEQVGETTHQEAVADSSSASVKYDDPQAEAAHQRAQERDPSDVVKLGEEISLVLREVDYSSHPPTIMGRKNSLVIFVEETPQDLSKHQTVQVKVVDYGGQNTSAEAVFVGYGN